MTLEDLLSRKNQPFFCAIGYKGELDLESLRAAKQEELTEIQGRLQRYLSDPSISKAVLDATRFRIDELKGEITGSGYASSPLTLAAYTTEAVELRAYFPKSARRAVLVSEEDELHAVIALRSLLSLGVPLDRYMPDAPAEQRLTTLKQAGLANDKGINQIRQIVGYTDTISGAGGSGRPPRQPFSSEHPLTTLRRRKQALERELGIPIDTDTYAAGSQVPLSLFANDLVLDAFRRAARDIVVSPAYLSGVVILNPFFTPSENKARELIGELTPDTPLAYDRSTRSIYVRYDVNLELFNGGGLHHEWAHAKIAQVFGDPKKTLTTVPIQYRDAVSDAYEEVAANLITYHARKKDNLFVRFLKDKYHIHSAKEADDFVLAYLSESTSVAGRLFRRIDKIAEAMAIFKMVDSPTYTYLSNAYQKYLSKLRGYETACIKTLVEHFCAIDLTNQNKYIANQNNVALSLYKGWNV